MASYKQYPRGNHYGIMQRGTSFTIPLSITDSFDNPLDLTGMQVLFTVKKVQQDFDATDSRAYIIKNFDVQYPTEGRFFIALSSLDLQFEVGEFYFDIEITSPITGSLSRLCTLQFTLEGGPSNRGVNNMPGQYFTGDEITVVALEQGSPIVVVTPHAAISSNISGDMDQLEFHMQSIDEEVKDLKEYDIANTERIRLLTNEVTALADEVARLRAIVEP